MNLILPTKGHLLVAEPSILGDPSFNRSVILLADYNSKGSLGFILNKPTEFFLGDFIPEIVSEFPIYNGGPVETDNLYFIHSVPELIEGSEEIAAGIFWGGDFEKVVELIKKGLVSFTDVQFFLGYSGWDAKQLDHELEENTWVVVENHLRDGIIGPCCDSLWREALLELGESYAVWSNAPENPNFN
jgi:putative transcriptional regulator